MSSDKICCVPGCTKKEGTVLHIFPNPEKERERFNTWLYAIGGDNLGCENERVYKYRRVCHSHFEQKYCCRGNRLSNVAVPTVNMPDTLTMMNFTHAERKPMQQITNVKQLQPSTSATDHGLQHHLESLILNPMGTKGAVTQNENAPVVFQKRMLTSNSPASAKEAQPNLEPETLPLEPTQEVRSSNPVVSGQKNPAPETLPLEPTQEVRSSNPVVSGQKNPDGKTASCVLPTARKLTRRRLLLTEREKDLHSTITAAKIKICKLRTNVQRQRAELKEAKKLACNPSVLKVIENCTSAAKLLLQIQWRENKKKQKGRRYTMQEKIIALSILKQSPKGYRFFRKIFILPAAQTLIKLVQRSHLQPGINKKIFSQLRKKASSMKVEEKLCVLLFDEVSLNPQLTYNEKKDKVAGFVDTGKERTAEFADHAQVFMVRGLIKNYKQPVAYTFSASATKGPELAAQIKQVVTELQQAGLIVVATVCDQGTNNSYALKILLNETRGTYLRRGDEPRANVILINEQEIFPLYDPPHLLKGMRNNLLTKNLKYVKDGVVKTAKWSHLQQLYKENPGYKGIRMIPKLTEDHINPERNKMKVKYASQIFSRTVGSNMGYLADKRILPSECKETADLLIFMDNLFDSVNGSYNKNRYAKPLLGPATPTSVHSKTWSESKAILRTVKFVTPAGKEETVPSVGNWVFTLNSIELLLKRMQEKYGVTSVWLRHLNQDPLENFFGSIRSHGCRNVNPTCDQFEGAFATLLINNINSEHTRGKNCEGDFCDALYALVVDDNSEPSLTCTVDFEKMMEIATIPIEEKEKDPRIIAPLQYISGYFLKQLKSHVFKDCQDCKQDFSTEDEVEYIKYREYADQRWLCTPSKELVLLISNMQDIVNEVMKDNMEKNMLKEIATTTVLALIDFKFIKCSVHKKKAIEYLTKIVIRFIIFNYCKNINKILAGRRDVDDDDDVLQVKAKKYSKKCFKRKK